MKNYRKALLLLVFGSSIIGAYMYDPFAKLGLVNEDYNPKYANAIQQRKPELCNDIKFAIKIDGSDSLDKIYGIEAIQFCEQQAIDVELTCFLCDSNAILNGLRKRYFHKSEL